MSQNKQLFLTLYERVHQSFERFCKARSYGQMPFKDLMQETLLIAYTKFDQLQEPDKFLYYLFGIASRIVSNHRRKVQYESLTEMDTVMTITQPAADRQAEKEQLYKALRVPSHREGRYSNTFYSYDSRAVCLYILLATALLDRDRI